MRHRSVLKRMHIKDGCYKILFYESQLTVIYFQFIVAGDDEISNSKLRFCSGYVPWRLCHENQTCQNL